MSSGKKISELPPTTTVINADILSVDTGIGVSPVSNYITVGNFLKETWVVKSGAYLAVARDKILADTSGGIFTITLPATPTVGDAIYVGDFAGTWFTDNLTLARNGEKINGEAEDLACDVNGMFITCSYTGATYGWRIG